MIDFFTLGLVLIMLHEMDAIRCKEWRILPGLSLLNDKLGLVVFTFLHIPLFYWVFTHFQQNSEGFRKGFDYFLIIHLVLHLLFLKHKKNEFKDWVSWAIISGAAFFGLLDLLI